MTTALDEIGDLLLSQISDYRLTTIYQTSGSQALNNYIENWLLLAIDDFDMCNQSLVYDSGSQVFSVTLNQRNKDILAQIMVQYWLLKEVNDVLQMNNFIQDKDFKMNSAAQNLREKRDLYNAKREEISQLLNSYGYRNNDWDSWDDQTFR